MQDCGGRVWRRRCVGRDDDVRGVSTMCGARRRCAVPVAGVLRVCCGCAGVLAAAVCRVCGDGDVRGESATIGSRVGGDGRVEETKTRKGIRE